ncbi:MAG: hypothetical protein H8E61_01940, partial [Bacteroidetes bacterium]|nr:hypothetical protein [Bacteroidota bacterium]
MNDFQLISLIVDNEENLIEIRDTSRKICESLGFSHLEQVKITTSVSEIGRNIYEYAKKGTIQFFYINNKNKQGIKIVATDQGPGIKNLDKILQGK